MSQSRSRKFTEKRPLPCEASHSVTARMPSESLPPAMPVNAPDCTITPSPANASSHGTSSITRPVARPTLLEQRIVGRQVTTGGSRAAS